MIERNEGAAPAGASIPELIAGRDWLFEGNSYYVDTSHLTSVIRFSLDLTDHDALGQVVEMAEYGSHLAPMFHERSEPPFDNFFADHAIYLRAIRGEEVDKAVAHFRKQGRGLRSGRNRDRAIPDSGRAFGAARALFRSDRNFATLSCKHAAFGAGMPHGGAALFSRRRLQPAS